VRILAIGNLYPPDVIGGYEVLSAQMVQALRRRGHTACVLTSRSREHVPEQQDVRRVFRLADIWNQYAAAHRPEPLRRTMDLESRWISAFNVQALVAEVEVFRPEVAYLHNLTGLGGLGIVSALQHLGIPWVWQLGDAVPSYCCARYGRIVPALAERFSQEATGDYIAVSARLVREIESHGVSLGGRVSILPYWIDGDRVEPPDRWVRKGALKVVSAGRLTPYKGIDALIEAVGLVKRRGYRVELDLYGGVADVDEFHYPRLIRQYEVTDRVRLRGPLGHRELLGRFREYEVFAFPTWEREPFGVGPLEAAAHGGCLPILSRNCGLAEWLVHGVHGLKVEPTAEALAQRFLDLLERRIPAEALATRAHEAAWRDFHVDRIASQIEAILERAAARKTVVPEDTGARVARLARLAESLAQASVAEAA